MHHSLGSVPENTSILRFLTVSGRFGFDVMLSQLRVDDFAIIDHLLLRLRPGFTVLTGETGAGKSIIIDALQAALGARMTASSVRSGADFASVEAVFDIADETADPALI